MKERYFDRLRWVEMFFAALAAFLGAVQWQMQQGQPFKQASMAGAVAALVAIGLYFREPKEAGSGAVESAVAPALSRLEAALQRAATPVDLSSGAADPLAPLGEPMTPVASGRIPTPRAFATLEDIPLRSPSVPHEVGALRDLPGVSSHEERVGDRTVHVMETPRRAATPEGPIDGAPPMHD